jgi:hypothetical protein
LFVGERQNIIYRTCLSSDLLKWLLSCNIKIDLIFQDAQMKDGDAERMLRLVRPLIYITHDYEPGKKGWYCIEQLMAIRPQLQLCSHGIMGVLTE